MRGGGAWNHHVARPLSRKREFSNVLHMSQALPLSSGVFRERDKMLQALCDPSTDRIPLMSWLQAGQGRQEAVGWRAS